MIQLLFFYFLVIAQAPPDPAAPPPAAAVKGPARPEDIKETTQALSAVVEDESLVARLTKPFIYDPAGKRDPFAAPEGKVAPLVPGALYGPLLELQEIRLDDVTVKGIYLDPVKPKALITYPRSGTDANKPKKIAIGDYLGENWGVVSSIREGQIIVVQTLEEGNKKSTTTRTLSIRK